MNEVCLPVTGIDTWMIVAIAAAAVVLIVAGVVALKSTKARIAALAIAPLAIAGIAMSGPAPAAQAAETAYPGFTIAGWTYDDGPPPLLLSEPATGSQQATLDALEGMVADGSATRSTTVTVQSQDGTQTIPMADSSWQFTNDQYVVGVDYADFIQADMALEEPYGDLPVTVTHTYDYEDPCGRQLQTVIVYTGTYFYGESCTGSGELPYPDFTVGGWTYNDDPGNPLLISDEPTADQADILAALEDLLLDAQATRSVEMSVTSADGTQTLPIDVPWTYYGNAAIALDYAAFLDAVADLTDPSGALTIAVTFAYDYFDECGDEMATIIDFIGSYEVQQNCPDDGEPVYVGFTVGGWTFNEDPFDPLLQSDVLTPDQVATMIELEAMVGEGTATREATALIFSASGTESVPLGDTAWFFNDDYSISIGFQDFVEADQQLENPLGDLTITITLRYAYEDDCGDSQETTVLYTGSYYYGEQTCEPQDEPYPGFTVGGWQFDDESSLVVSDAPAAEMASVLMTLEDMVDNGGAEREDTIQLTSEDGSDTVGIPSVNVLSFDDEWRAGLLPAAVEMGLAQLDNPYGNLTLSVVLRYFYPDECGQTQETVVQFVGTYVNPAPELLAARARAVV